MRPWEICQCSWCFIACYCGAKTLSWFPDCRPKGVTWRQSHCLSVTRTDCRIWLVMGVPCSPIWLPRASGWTLSLVLPSVPAVPWWLAPPMTAFSRIARVRTSGGRGKKKQRNQARGAGGYVCRVLSLGLWVSRGFQLCSEDRTWGVPSEEAELCFLLLHRGVLSKISSWTTHLSPTSSPFYCVSGCKPLARVRRSSGVWRLSFWESWAAGGSTGLLPEESEAQDVDGDTYSTLCIWQPDK